MKRPRPAHWQQLMPGVYDDQSGGLHLVLSELLEGAGYADTLANRQMLIEAARETFGAITIDDEVDPFGGAV